MFELKHYHLSLLRTLTMGVPVYAYRGGGQRRVEVDQARLGRMIFLTIAIHVRA